MSSRTGTLKALRFPGVFRNVLPPPDVFLFTETTSNDATGGDCATIATPRDRASAEHTSRRVMMWLQWRPGGARRTETIRLRAIELIDHEDFARHRRGYKFQSELFGQRAEQRANSERLQCLADQRIRVSDGGQRNRSEAQFEVVRAAQSGPID